MRSFLFISMLLWAFGARAEGTTVGVLSIDANGLSPNEVETLADAVTTAAHELLPARVLGPAEVRELLRSAGAVPAKRCKAKRCWMKVGRSAGLDAVLAIRAVGNKRGVALSFKWVDVPNKRIAARHQQPIRRNMLSFAEDARGAVERLRKKLEGKIPDPVPPPAATVAAVEPAATESMPEPPAVEPEAEPPAPEPAPEPPAPEPAGDTAVAVSTSVAMAAPATAEAPPVATSRSVAKVWLGLDLGHGSPGAVVRRVAAGGPGEAARLQSGDVIREWDGWVITTAKDVLGFALRTGAGRTARIKVMRGGSEKMLSLTPAELTDGAESDAFETRDYAGAPSTRQARPADSAPPGWPPPGAQQQGSSKRKRKRGGINDKLR